MLLNDGQIEIRCTGGEPLITPFDGASLLNCSYLLHADRAFVPESGAELRGVEPMVWTIDPGQALVVKTREHVFMPGDLMGMYTQLNRWAVKGLSLMNASLVEPYYSGPLSCQLVNFSRFPVRLRRGEPISKLTFHNLESPASPKPQAMSDFEYDAILCESAYVHPQSFLGIADVEDKITSKIEKTIMRTVKFPGIFLAIMVIVAAVEPWFSNFVYTHNGMALDATTKEVSELREDIKDEGSLVALKSEQANLRQVVEQLRAQMKGLQERR